MFYKAKELKLNICGVEFSYITFGKGKRPLVMIQGLNTREIKGMAPILAYTYRIFSKDYKVYMFGRRPEIQKGITVKEIAEDIAASMDELGISNADIFGVSQGGMIAQYLAIDRPDLVRKLVLAVTLSKNNATVKSVIKEWNRMAEQGRMRELITDMAVKMYSDSYVRRYRIFLPLLTALQKPKDIQRFIILAESCLTCNTYDLLPQMKCPVLVLGGRQDQIVTGEASEQIAEKLKCKIIMYEELGHAAYEEAKDFNQKVYDFFMENPYEKDRNKIY